MDIQVGRYHLRSDGLSLWIDEEYETKTKTGKKRVAKKRVAGYAPNITLLMRQFMRHRYMSADAETMRELLKVLQQTLVDMDALKKAAVKEDFKVIRRIDKDIKELNKGNE